MTPAPTPDPTQQAADDLLVALGDTDIVLHAWQPDGQGIQPGGIVGGDGAAESLSVRYLNRYVPVASITSYFYVVDTRERGDQSSAPFRVEHMVESYLTDRPITEDDAVEVWSDYEYHTDAHHCFATEAEAEARRDRLAAEDTGGFYLWDGTATNGRAVR